MGFGKTTFRKDGQFKFKNIHPVVRFLVFPVIFETTAEVLRQIHFLDFHVIVFVEADRITTSTPIILSIYQ